MAPALPNRRTITINRDFAIPQYEYLLNQLPISRTKPIVTRLPSQYGSTIYGDIWATIVVGTLCRRGYSELKIVAAGHQHYDPDGDFTQSLPGLTAVQMSDRVRTDSDESIDIDRAASDISLSRGGILEQPEDSPADTASLLEQLSGKTRTLIELDPQFPIANAIRGSSGLARRTFFESLITDFRRVLELGYSHHGRPVWSIGTEPANLIKFFSELHENAYHYSRAIEQNGRTVRGLRFIRLKAHLATNTAELLRRAPADSPILYFLERIAQGKGPQGVMEAAISDFGYGIVDHFLMSQRGAQYRDYNRRQLLQKLIHERLTSSPDPGAGLGIWKALDAARAMRGLVSVRTGEFWLAQDFSNQNLYDRKPVLEDVPGDRAKIAGTHWQFLWPMGI